MHVRLLIGILLIGVVGLGAAADLPKRKPGLWQMTVESSRSRRPPTRTRYCIDADTESLMDALAGGMTHKDCSKNERHNQGNQVVVDSVCVIDSSTATGHIVISGDDSNVHMQMHTHFSPALHGSEDVDTTQVSSWLGECPADMKPGDFVTPQGLKLNLKDIARMNRQ